MSTAHAPHNSAVLKGWRAQIWAWVLFVALFRGLIPHAAIASVVMDGNPALLWCAPGSGSVESKAASVGMGAAHDCVCASAGDGAMPLRRVLLPTLAGVRQQSQSSFQNEATTQRVLPPPARGPPSL